MNYSEIASVCGVELTTVQSWLAILEANGIVRRLQPFATNLNSRLIKAPKFFIEDVALASRLQGWTERQPLLLSPVAGALLETLAVAEVSRFFINRGLPPRLAHLRSKDQVEIDLLVHLSDDRTIAIEVKSTPTELDKRQLRLLDTLGITVVERWVATPTPAPDLATARVVPFDRLWNELDRLEPVRH
jgi:predicted AAA+ superfamily ATPase